MCAQMTERLVTRGFVGRRRAPRARAARAARPVRDERLPGPVGRPDAAHAARAVDVRASRAWSRDSKSWTWAEFNALPSRDFVVDISCVTKWTKLDMRWHGVSVDTLLEAVELQARRGVRDRLLDGGYTTNLPLADVVNDQAFVAYGYDGAPLTPEHGGPARLVVPHLYFWKSAKWIRGLRIVDRDQPGFWESFGYHNRGDPWLEERYSGD